MKHVLQLVLALYLPVCTPAQVQEPVITGKKEMIYSRILRENRKIWIYSPAQTAPHKVAGKKYPVLYLLDGDAHFYSTVGMIQHLSQANGNGVVPEMMVVGIEHPNRLRDLTPHLPPADQMENAHPFVQFLSRELIPYIDSNYPAAPYKILAGHSLGGLTAIDILTQFPDLFNACIAIDPSLWYNGEQHLRHYLTRLPQQNLKGKKLFTGIANTLPRGMTVSKMKTDQSASTQHIRSIFRLDAYLRRHVKTLSYASKYYSDERHNTVPLLAAYDGLRFIFDYYFFDATEQDFADSTPRIAGKIKAHYLKVSEQLGYRETPPASLINYLGYEALSKQHFSKAEALFKLNIEYYPDSSNGYDSYGDYFAAKNDTAGAISCYRKALQISRDEHTQSKLSGLEKSDSFHLALDELKKYAGKYLLENYNLYILLEIRDGKLFARVQGQADSELVPLAKDVFTVKDKQGYTLTFSMAGDQPTGFTSVQPNGVFKAVYKNE